MSWTDERIATLKKMWEGGSTASQIADELGGVSRNAVIGKAHRLGLKARPSPVKAAEKKAVPPKKAKPAAKPVAKKPQVRADAPPADSAPAPSASPASAAPVADRQPEPDAEPAAAGSPGHSQPLPNRAPNMPKIVSVGPGGFLRQGPGDQQPPIPPAPPRRLVPAKPRDRLRSNVLIVRRVPPSLTHRLAVAMSLTDWRRSCPGPSRLSVLSHRQNSQHRLTGATGR